MDLKEQYYEKGFFSAKLTELHRALLWNEISNTVWVPDTVDNIYKEIPDWYISNANIKDINGSNRFIYERSIGQHIFSSAPESLKQIAADLLTMPIFDFVRSFYERHELKFLDLWNGSEDIPYHFDTINGCDMLVLVYLTEETVWDKQWGGTVSMKKQVNNAVMFEEEYLPVDGSMLIINNSNPLVYHKVTALKNTAVNRYTFSFNYNWL